MATQIVEIQTSKLSVDLGNFRIGDQENVRDAYKAMISEEKENLYNLADDIISLGLSPADPFIVCPDEENPKSFIVCEGNRRLTCIRLLETPALAADTLLHKRFLKLSKEYLKKPIKQVSCVVVDNKKSALQWIQRKHLTLGGRGVHSWGAPATTRADAFRGKVRPSAAVLEHLKAQRLLPKQLEDSLSGQTTNIDRVFQTAYLNRALGIKIEKDGVITYANGDAKAGDKLLRAILDAMAVKGFTVNDIRHAPDRMTFIDQFTDQAVLADEETTGSNGSTAAKKKAPATKRGGRPLPTSLDRTTLAIKGRDNALQISEPRLNALYHEALSLNPDSLPNCAAILTRVFLELSTDHFLVKKKIEIPSKYKGKKHWSDIGIPLSDKIRTVMSVIDPDANDPEFKEVRRGLGNKDLVHSVDALHEVMHQKSADRDPKEVKRIWGRWHPYWMALFDAFKPAN